MTQISKPTRQTLDLKKLRLCHYIERIIIIKKEDFDKINLGFLKVFLMGNKSG